MVTKMMVLSNHRVHDEAASSFNIAQLIIKGHGNSLHPVDDAQLAHDVIDMKIYCPFAYL